MEQVAYLRKRYVITGANGLNMTPTGTKSKSVPSEYLLSSNRFEYTEIRFKEYNEINGKWKYQVKCMKDTIDKN